MRIDNFLGFGSDACAILGPDGVITAVNRVWTDAAEAAGAAAGSGVGVDYVAVCNRAVHTGAPQAELALDTVTDLLEGRRARASFLYPCTAPDRLRWFRVDGVVADDTGRVGLRHVDVTAVHRSGDGGAVTPLFEAASSVLTRAGLHLALADALDGPPHPAVTVMMTELQSGDTAVASAAEVVADLDVPGAALARLDEHTLAVLISASDAMAAISTADTLMHAIGRPDASAGARWALVNAVPGEDATTVIARGRRSLLRSVDSVDEVEDRARRSARLHQAAGELTRAVAEFDRALDRGADMGHLRELDARVVKAERAVVDIVSHGS